MYVKLSFSQYQMLLGMAQQARPAPDTSFVPSPIQALSEASHRVTAVSGAEAAAGGTGDRPHDQADWVRLTRRYADSAHAGEGGRQGGGSR